VGLRSKVAFKGLTQFTAAVAKARSNWPRCANKLTKTSSGQIADLYRDNLSGSQPSTSAQPLPVGVRTGTLLAGVEEVQINQFRMDIVNRVHYSGWIEHGTCKMTARRPLQVAVEDYTGESLPTDSMAVMREIWRV
jgi:hypothetical protein